MTRRAILLSASHSSASPTTVEFNRQAWQHFLGSNQGGAWSEQEITQLKNPNREATIAAVRAAKDTDYSLLVFAGRAEIRKGDLPWPEAHILLSDGSSLSETQLNPSTPRCTMVFDCSTGVSPEVAQPDGRAGQCNDQSRALFDQALQKAEGGLVKIYASESASAPSHGLSFSGVLILTAMEWAKTNHGALSLPQAVSLVNDADPKRNSQLKTEYQGGRRLYHFPLAVTV